MRKFLKLFKVLPWQRKKMLELSKDPDALRAFIKKKA